MCANLYDYCVMYTLIDTLAIDNTHISFDPTPTFDQLYAVNSMPGFEMKSI